ncbi:unnamed protein product [Porites lobata]|uniref:Uncharacterized protein n=1 Tax=Porites lobata TaxID=104759 RepID=A0ABN8R231_9CNID|nr:unnamed protein product [Porites lobata]
MNLLVVLVLVPCFCLTIDGKGFLAGEDPVNNNDDRNFLNFYDEEPKSFVNGIEDFFPQRYIDDQFSGESSGIQSPCTENPCLNDGNCSVIASGDYSCACPGGYYGKNCETANLCYKNPCKNGGKCKSRAGRSYYCKCAQGFQGKNCEEAVLVCSSDVCGENANCENTVGSYICMCKSGYARRNLTGCSDINECAIGADACDVNAKCKNTVGSYTCTCKKGFTGNGETCTDINECSTGADACDVNAKCKNTVGSYTCSCKKGFTGNGKTCTDINECSTGADACDADAKCKNTVGSFICTCKKGFSGKGKTCTDINECSTGADACDVNAKCKNTVGSYTCTCKKGFTGKGKTCTDINECSTGADDCDVNAKCKNNVGSYTCTCKKGFTGNGKTCTDIDECAVQNGGCSHDCENTPGSYECECPDAELSLAEDNHTCEAKGVLVRCLQNKMSITIPKPLLKGMDREHIRLLDPKCGATENATHFTLTTALTKCNTTRRHTKSSIVYSNTVLEIPLKNNDIITRVREIEIPFSCYYSNKRTATAVGMRPENRKLVFSEKGEGNFTIVLELFHNKRFVKSYSASDYPLSFKLRQLMFFQAKVQSKDKRLSILAKKCFATPTPDQKNPKKHFIMDNGCPVDDTLELYSSPTGTFRFGLEAFEFVDQPFVFVHCHVIVCNATDRQSRCARGCEKKPRLRREVQHHEIYSLAQGPITLDRNKEYKEPDNNLAIDSKVDTAAGDNLPLLAAMAAMTALTMFGVAFMAFKKR